MARKPKNISSDSPIDAAKATRPDGAPAVPGRRGRKTKLAAIPAEGMVAPSHGNAAEDTIVAGGTLAGIDAAPARRRPGPKPRQPVKTAETAPVQAKRGRKARALSPGSLDATPASDDEANSAFRSTATSDSDAASSVILPEPNLMAGQEAMPSGAKESAEVPVQPAADWDRATDTVRFDWAAIEQTASREGPNQAMAKLLIGARAEGANSRWPL